MANGCSTSDIIPPPPTSIYSILDTDLYGIIPPARHKDMVFRGVKLESEDPAGVTAGQGHLVIDQEVRRRQDVQDLVEKA